MNKLRQFYTESYIQPAKPHDIAIEYRNPKVNLQGNRIDNRNTYSDSWSPWLKQQPRDFNRFYRINRKTGQVELVYF
jgi:hypothetical protein